MCLALHDIYCMCHNEYQQLVMKIYIHDNVFLFKAIHVIVKIYYFNNMNKIAVIG